MILFKSLQEAFSHYHYGDIYGLVFPLDIIVLIMGLVIELQCPQKIRVYHCEVKKCHTLFEFIEDKITGERLCLECGINICIGCGINILCEPRCVQCLVIPHSICIGCNSIIIGNDLSDEDSI